MKFELTNEKSNYLKGLAILFILLGHIGVFRYGGFIGVGLFLFLSGYGLYFSYTKNGLKKYWQKRITKVLIPYWIFNTIWIIIDIILKNRPGIMAIIGSYLTYKNIIDITMWYISFLMVWYVLFYLIFKIAKTKIVQFIFLGASIAVMYILSRMGIFGLGGGAQFYVLMFPLGIIACELFKNYHNKIGNVILPFMTIMLFLLLYIYNNSFNNTLEYVPSVIMIFSIVVLIVLVMGFNNYQIHKNDIIGIYGKYSYFIYLIEGVILNKYNYMSHITNNKLIYNLIFVISVLILGVLLSKLYDKVYNYINKKAPLIMTKKKKSN